MRPQCCQSRASVVLRHSLGQMIQMILMSLRPHYPVCSCSYSWSCSRSCYVFKYACVCMHTHTHTNIFGEQIGFILALVMLSGIAMADTKYSVKTNQLKWRDWRDKCISVLLFHNRLRIGKANGSRVESWSQVDLCLLCKNIILLANVTKPPGKNNLNLKHFHMSNFVFISKSYIASYNTTASI